MRNARLVLLIVAAIVPAPTQEKTDGPADEKAKKTYKTALEYLQRHETSWALDEFKKADKQDGGHCLACQKQMVKYGLELEDWKTAELGATEILEQAQGENVQAYAHYQLGLVYFNEGVRKHKEEFFSHAHEENAKALALVANFPAALFDDGVALAHLKQDDQAKARFEQYAQMKSGSANDPQRQRALRYISRIELARARMAPAFAIKSMDGQQISMDDLQGKVVLLDFWATWCVPCREALPHIKNVAKKFQGEPLVILSVSLDTDEKKWKEFIDKNGMTWPQYRDGGFTGPISRMFAVNAIPHTFTIDADGVLQDEHIGDASIEGKLKKLIAHARELQTGETLLK